MNILAKAKESKNIRQNLLAGVALLVLLALSLAGATYAWMADQYTTTNIFTAGTVDLTTPVPDFTGCGGTGTAGDIGAMVVIPDPCKTVCWTFTSTGTKTSFVRVKPDAEAILEARDTAFGGVRDPNLTYPGPPRLFAQYFEYNSDPDAGDDRYKDGVLTIKIVAGRNRIPVGTAQIRNDGNTLYFNIVMDPGVDSVKDIHIYIAKGPPPLDEITPPGDLGWTIKEGTEGFENPNFSGSTTVDRIKEPIDFDENPLYYIVIHMGGVERTALVPITRIEPFCNHSSNWVEGDGGWWYYATLSGDCEGPRPVIQNEKVTVCFAYYYDCDEDTTLTVSLVAEAVQWTHGAINAQWDVPEHPWHPLPDDWEPCD